MWQVRAVALALAFVVGWRQGAQRVEAQWAAERLEQSEAAREVERLSTLARSKVADETHRTLARLRVDAGGARDELERVRVASTVAGRACADAAATGNVEAAAVAGMVQAYVFERAADRATELAAAVDASHAVGLGCQRADEALTERKP